MEPSGPHKPRARRAPGAAPLAQYRLYFLHRDDRRITFSHEYEAESDERAVRIAEGWREGRCAELWCGGRKLASWEADD